MVTFYARSGANEINIRPTKTRATSEGLLQSFCSFWFDLRCVSGYRLDTHTLGEDLGSVFSRAPRTRKKSDVMGSF